PHHYYVGDEAAAVRRVAVGPVVEAIARHHDLADDLARGEVAHQPLRSGMTEGAIQRAADLRRNAQRAAIGLRNIDALDFMRSLELVAAWQAQQPFAGAIAGNLLGGDLGSRDGEMLFELLAHFPGNARHVRKLRCAADIGPVP